MEENRLIWYLLEREQFEFKKIDIWEKASKILEDYGIENESVLSNTQLQALARMSVVRPGLKGKALRDSITKFINHQAEKGKPGQGYRKVSDGIELGKALCDYLLDDLGRVKDSLRIRISQDMADMEVELPPDVDQDIVQSQLVQEFIGHLVDLARVRRKEGQ